MPVLKRFLNHRPTPEGIAKIEALRAAFSSLYEKIEELVPNSRERALALTELETSSMWAVRSIVLNDPGSKPDEIRPA